MKIKLAIIYGILIWIITYVLSLIFNPIFSSHMTEVNIVTPLIIIIVTGFFGILYIRNINENEVIEGVLVGMIFIIIDIFCDYIFLIMNHHTNPFTENYPLHVFSMIIITLLITTFLGYLAQMKIDLK